MTLSIVAVPAGPLETNAYVVKDEETGAALVIDAPPQSRAWIEARLAEMDAQATAIVITHPHWDHIGDAAEIAAATGAPVLAHPAAAERLAAPGSALMALPFEIPPVAPGRWIEAGDLVALGDHRFTVLHLPGHEPSHIALLSLDDRVFLGGDVLFPNGHGRIDIPGADPEAMNRTLSQVAALPSDVTVYPGHGATTTIGAETWLARFREDDVAAG